MKSYKFPFSVAYADTDAGGIVYHGRYIEFAERARMQWLHGIELPKGDIGFVVSEQNIKYIRPLHLADDFYVESSILKMGAVSMSVEQKFVKDGEIYAIINITIAYIGKNMRPKKIPDSIINKLSLMANKKGKK